MNFTQLKKFRKVINDNMSVTNEFLSGCKELYFSGIGGISMSSIAAFALDKGCIVSGSDKSRNENVIRLEKRGVKIFSEHAPENISPSCDALIYTAALDSSNPELVRAREMNIPVVSRARYLGYLMSEYKNRVGVSGTHGKTTTTGMISHIFLTAGLDPTIASGAMLPEIGGAYHIGSRETIVYEACEYKDSFLSFCPTDAVITNIELDHTDYFKSIDQMIDSFSKAVSGARRVFVNKDNSNAIKALENYKGEIITVSLSDESADFYVRDLSFFHGCGSYRLFHKKEEVCLVHLPVIGKFNVYNSLCAAALTYTRGVSGSVISKALMSFTGAARRFECRAVIDGVSVYDDYAHHPSECRSTLEAAEGLGYGNLYCIFQPHTYSRTRDLLEGFEETFRDAADKGVNVIFAKIYPARETDTLGISSQKLAEDTGALSFESFEEIASFVASKVKKGDLVLTMGAGDVYKVGLMLIDKLEKTKNG